MSDFDAALRSFLLNFVLLPISVIILTWLLFKKPLMNLYYMLYARIVGSDRFIGRKNRVFGHEKELLFGPLWTLKGDKRSLTLLEIGPGGGTNFKFYPKGTNIICVDPNPNFQSYLEKNATKFPHVNIKQFLIAKGEEMSDVPDGICDAVVCTMVLCSVKDIGPVLKEVKRVLKPEGMFFYLEHVAAGTSTWSYKIQSFLNPVWKRLTAGCHLNRETWTSIDAAGFSEVEYRRFTIKSRLLILKYYLSGTATK